MRVALFKAAHVMLTRSAKGSSLKAWRMWVDGTEFRFAAGPVTPAVAA